MRRAWRRASGLLRPLPAALLIVSSVATTVQAVGPPSPLPGHRLIEIPSTVEYIAIPSDVPNLVSYDAVHVWAEDLHATSYHCYSGPWAGWELAHAQHSTIDTPDHKELNCSCGHGIRYAPPGVHWDGIVGILGNPVDAIPWLDAKIQTHECWENVPDSLLDVTLEIVGSDDRYFDVGKEIEVRATLIADADNADVISAIDWDAVVLVPDDMLELIAGPEPGAVPENFSMAPGEELIRTFRYRAARPGVLELSSTAIGKSAKNITIKAPPARREIELELELLKVELEISETLVELESDEGGPIPKEVEATLRITNVFDEDIHQVVIESVNPVSLIVPPPVDDAVTVTAGPSIPIVGTIKTGETVEVPYTLTAKNDGHYEVVAIVQAKDPFTAVGVFHEHGSDEIKVSDDVLLYFDSSAENTVSIGGNDWVDGGHQWRVFGRLKNRSLDDSLLVLVQPNVIGNAFYAQPIPIGTEAPDSECAMGIAKILAPQEEVDFIAPVRTLEEGGTRGTVRFEPKGFLLNENGTKTALTDEQVFFEKGSTEHIVRVNVADDPPYDAFTVDLIGHYSVGVVDGLGTFAEGIIGMAGLAFHAIDFAANPWAWDDTYRAVADKLTKYLLDIHAGLPPGDKEAWEQDMLAKVVLTLDVSLGDAKELVDTAVSERLTRLSTAWYTGDSRDVAKILGEISGENPDLVLQSLVAGYGICKLAHKGALAAERGLKGFAASQAATLETRAAQGCKALRAGDVLDYVKHLRPIFGIDELTDYMLREFAREWNIMIVVRRRGAGVIAKLESGFYALKPYFIKAKNVNHLDVDWLGFPHQHLDEVVIKQPPPWSEVQSRLSAAAQDPDTVALVRSRWETRWKEWYGKEADYVTGEGGELAKSERFQWYKYEDNGGIDVAENTLTGLEDNFEKGFSFPTDDKLVRKVKFKSELKMAPDGRPCYVAKLEKPGSPGFWLGVTGDIDPMAFLMPDGTILPPAARLELYRALRYAGFQHPESLTWNNAKGLAEYLDEFSAQRAGTESMACYRPDGSVTATRFDPGKSWVDPVRARTAAQLFFRGHASLRSKDPTPKDASGFEELIDKSVPTYIAPDTWALVNPDCPGSLPLDGDAQPLGAAQSCAIDVHYSNDPDAIVLRQTKIGQVERWTPAGGWHPYFPTGTDVYLLPQTALSTDAEAGDTEVEIFDLQALGLDPEATQWFEEGQVLVINPGGATEENAVIDGFGSIILEEPLKFFHEKGELISVVPNLIPGTTLTTTTTLDPGVPPEEPEVLSITPSPSDPFTEITVAMSPFEDQDEAGPASGLQVVIGGPLDDGTPGTIYVADVPVASPQVVHLPPALLDPGTEYSILTRYYDSTGMPSDFSAAKKFTTPVVDPADADADGIEDSAEIVGTFDLNGNGIDDATDGFPVFKNPESGSAYGITTGRGSVGNVRTYSALEIAQIADVAAPGTLFAGMTGVRTDNLPMGALINMFYFLPVYNLGVDRFFSYDPNLGYLEETALMFLQTGRAVVRRTDGGAGDLDGVANGRIVSTGGPAKAAPAVPACSTPISNRTDKPISSDCLFILRAAVGSTTCSPACRCAPKGTLPITASDALRCLRAAVGQSGVSLDCPCS